MSLKEYRSKRNLKKSSEPLSGKKHTGFLRFCVQKHAARHLHYDFRLEYRGALLSWAIPKGPSMNPKIKRLAIKVEDHPLDYQYFEGVIPKGNYGAGTVKIWDHGFYTSADATEPKRTEKALSQGLKKGHFTVVIKGKKIKGEFVFQKLKTDKDNTWLLMKKADEYASS
jgi:bifunctional non-homologous end joining protein LigD